MTETEVQTEVQHTSEDRKSLQDIGQEAEFEEPLSLLAAVALAPRGGERAPCSRERAPCTDMNLQQVLLLMRKAEDFQDCLVTGQSDVEREALAAAVLSFLNTCRRYFNHLESISAISQHTSLPFDICTRRGQLLGFSQQLCDRLEQLVLTYVSYNLLCLDESEPNSVSHFCIGQRRLGPLRVTAFRYWKPAPYLTRVNTGLFKRMRWNVVRQRDDEQQTDEEKKEREADTEYYFLCYEDIPNEDSQGVSHGNVVRMWSIGQWVQVTPETDDIYDWIMCEVPHGGYHRLLSLGSEEPSSCSATEYLQQLLLVSPHTAE